jgi:hypothetical protein
MASGDIGGSLDAPAPPPRLAPKGPNEPALGEAKGTEPSSRNEPCKGGTRDGPPAGPAGPSRAGSQTYVSNLEWAIQESLSSGTEVGAISPGLGRLHGLTFDASGNLYVASQGGSLARKDLLPLPSTAMARTGSAARRPHIEQVGFTCSKSNFLCLSSSSKSFTSRSVPFSLSRSQESHWNESSLFEP